MLKRDRGSGSNRENLTTVPCAGRFDASDGPVHVWQRPIDLRDMYGGDDIAAGPRLVRVEIKAIKFHFLLRSALAAGDRN